MAAGAAWEELVVSKTDLLRFARLSFFAGAERCSSLESFMPDPFCDWMCTAEYAPRSPR